jgi:hypothetical protein
VIKAFRVYVEKPLNSSKLFPPISLDQDKRMSTREENIRDEYSMMFEPVHTDLLHHQIFRKHL